MVEQTTAIDILHTKLYRPPVPNELVVRQHLIDVLNKNINVPFTLISAPAGYGKSTLISNWLENCVLRSAWISLDEFDSDLRHFYCYLVAAINKIYPDTCKTARSLLRLAEMPSVVVLARQLLNDLEPVREQFVLVLDDYQFIKNNSVTRLLEELLQHPHPSLNIVVCSRRDPALPLGAYRAKGQINELRVNDLRFSTKDTGSFIKNFLGISMDAESLNLLDRKLEGWPTGLLLTALTLKSGNTISQVVEDLPDDNTIVLDYIVKEVIFQQPENVQRWLLSASILGRFCAELCEAICFDGDQDLNGDRFIQWLLTSNLFLVPLDTVGTWYRFHHLFRKMLLDQLKLQSNSYERSELYRKAGQWFEKHDYFDEAIHFLLAGEDVEAAGHIVCKYRYELMNKEHWHKLVDWLAMLPQDIIERNLDLLLLKARLFDKGTPLADVKRYLEIVDDIIVASGSAGTSVSKNLIAEYHSYRAWLYYLDGDGKNAVQYSQMSLTELDSGALSIRGTSTVILAMSYQMMGNLDKAYEAIFDAFESVIDTGSALRSKLLTALCFVHWISANTEGVVQVGKELLRLGSEQELPESISSAHYFLGQVYYVMDELDKAEQEFTNVIDKQFIANIWDYTHSAFGLSLIYNSQGKHEKAATLARDILRMGIDKSNKDIIKLAQAFMIELSIRSADTSSIKHWSDTYKPYPLNPGHRSYIPQLTLAKSLIEPGLDSDTTDASALLSELHNYCLEIHNRKYIVDVLSLQSVLLYRQKAQSQAIHKLREATAIAEQGKMYRPFLDLGSCMFDLIDHLVRDSQASEFIRNLHQRFEFYRDNDHRQQIGKEKAVNLPTGNSYSGYQLTLREIELLKLLSNGMSNSDIAEQLFISVVTVKKHLSNIYKKLQVKNRAQAVMKAASIKLSTNQH